MNKTVHFSLALIFTVSFNAWAAPGATFAATADYKNPKDVKGLCTPADGNDQEFYYKFGLCDWMSEFFRKPCMQSLLEDLRQKVLKPNPDGKAENNFDLGQGSSCSGKDKGNTPGGRIDGKNKVAFDNYIMQFMAGVVIQESNWDTLNNLQNTAGANHDGKTGGLLNLTNRKLYDDPENACGCKSINSQGQGNSPGTSDKTSGDKDGFQNLSCGTYIALKQAQKDGTLISGQKQSGAGGSSDDNKPKGLGVIFPDLQETTGDHPVTDLANNPKLNNLLKKMSNYCETMLSTDGSFSDDAWNRTCPKDLGGYCSGAPSSGTNR